jgi:hypothetical protein
MQIGMEDRGVNQEECKLAWRTKKVNQEESIGMVENT